MTTPSPETPAVFRNTEPSDAPTLVRFARQVFGVEWTEDFVRWKYFDNPAGRIFGGCAEIDDQPAAFYGNIPVRLKIGDQTVLGAQAVDAMVLPEARRRKLFLTIARETYRQMDEAKVAATYVFPNPASYAAFIERLGWMPVGTVPRYTRVLDARGMARAGGRTGPAGTFYALWLRVMSRPEAVRPWMAGTGGLSIVPVAAFDERFDQLWRVASESFPAAVVRDSVYLNWRYLQRPGGHYVALAAERAGQLAGFAVLSLRDVAKDGVAALTELLLAPGEAEAGLALLAEVTRRARLAHAAQLQAWLLPHQVFYRGLLEDGGFVFRPGRTAPGALRYRTLFIARPHPTRTLDVDLAHEMNWCLSAGDYDYF